MWILGNEPNAGVEMVGSNRDFVLDFRLDGHHSPKHLTLKRIRGSYDAPEAFSLQ